jgi:hypothetical protein
MVDLNTVKKFLDELKVKIEVYGVLFKDDRGKNLQTLIDLEITARQRIACLMELKSDDYSEGPLKESYYGKGEMWVFGTMIKEKEIYIKITPGAENNSPVCISFHIAEYPMTYPLRIIK